MMRKYYSCSSSIDENNEIISRSWIVLRKLFVAKLTSATEFSTAKRLTPMSNCNA